MKNKEKKKKQSLVEKAKLFVKDYRRQLPLQMMVIPGIIFMIIFCYMPIYGLTIAFKSYSVIDTTIRQMGLDGLISKSLQRINIFGSRSLTRLGSAS